MTGGAFEAVFDEEDALRRSTGDEILLAEVIRFALEDIPSLIEETALFLEAGNPREASRLAHKIKGTAGAVGALRLYGSAFALEMAGREGAGVDGALLEPVSRAFEAFAAHPRVRALAALDGGPSSR